MLIVAVVGPTATGKSDLALDLAHALQARGEVLPEIVNADAYQLYRHMDVGTAKVPPSQRRGVVHHQVDVIEPSEDASVARYQELARADLDAIAGRGARAIVAGGSGLYVRALLDDMVFPGTDPVVRAAIEARAEREGARALHEELARVDPRAAEAIGPRNTRRIVRALEVIEISGQPYTATLPRQEYVRPAVQIGLDCDRGVLDDRVAQRVDRMWELGLVEEVRSLADVLGTTASRAVGYREVLEMLDGESTPDEARAAVTASTRRLARKQMGWFGRDPRVHWLDARAEDLVDRALAVVDAAEAGPRSDADPDGTGPVRRRLGA
ncbi:tRNA (adenosine(37)-N6)-dimethylallyltransferase MiaA [Sanguibacter sp. 25GB23B1]|uniref:tRNA (adenosine(37)-N6)-dimethylallyltransferase MiaA n=1 Tax=unclassified Sanguibacter TaxID=2645534 RepID=UPI0032AF7F25